MKALNEIPDAWRLAIQRERDAHEFYQRMAQSATDESTRSLFETLAEQEFRHRQLLETEYRRIFESDMEGAKEQLPITWYEWDEESFSLAEALDLPVMLYITATWCEPCHLMERSALADQQVIDLLNDHFIPVRVDADKRPDVDSRYNQGGWPTTAFLNAEGELLEGHTFLTTDEMRGVLRRVVARYAGELEGAPASAGVRAAMAPVDLARGTAVPGDLAPSIVKTVREAVFAAYDEQHGGFVDPDAEGPETRSKFHHADALEFAMALGHRTGDARLLEMVHATHTAMAENGLYDPVDGGFFRYSTQPDWSQPHTEKLLGDNAHLLSLYLRLYQATGCEPCLATAKGVLRFLERSMWDRDQGFFYSSQDADPEYYALDAAGRTDHETPFVDKVLYSERNAVAISAFLLSAAVLGEPRYADMAERALESLWQKSYQEGWGMHHYVDTQPHLPGLLADQVAVAHALLDAYEHTGGETHLTRAQTLARTMDEALRNGDGSYYDTPELPGVVGRLRRRDKSLTDNALAGELNLRLYRLTGVEDYRTRAGETLSTFASAYETYGFEAARYALAVDRFLRSPLLITVVGETEDALRAELIRAARCAYAGNKTVQAVDPVWEPERLARLGYPAQPSPVAYVCHGTLCARPTADPHEILAQVQAMAGSERQGQPGSTWGYEGYRVEEGFKPEPRERFQYFFRVLRDDERVFRYCVWASAKELSERWPDLDLGTEAGQRELQLRLSAEGRQRVEAKIDARDFQNWLLDLRADSAEETVLEEKEA
jgi:uncharacterized protein YyaL (SSP411 family)